MVGRGLKGMGTKIYGFLGMGESHPESHIMGFSRDFYGNPEKNFSVNNRSFAMQFVSFLRESQ